MYFELEDFRPDTPRAPSVISVREGVLLSIIAHLIAVVAYLLMPKAFFETAAQPVPLPEHDQVKFVAIEPLKDKPAPPKLNAPQSDLDRQAATREKAPKPENVDPYMRGNTPDKVEGATPQQPERAKGPDNPQNTPPQPAQPTQMVPEIAAKLPSETPNAQKPSASGNLGDRLRNLTSVLQGQNYDNEKGGQAQQNADIQFDSKGVDFGPWLRRFRAQVMSNWFVPETAMFMQGHVVLQFYVHRDGSITDLTVVQPSSIDSFTKSSYNAMKLTQQAKTQPLPADYPADKVLFTVTFFYNER